MIGRSDDRQTLQRDLEEQGFAVLPAVFSSGEIIALLVSLADLTQGNYGAGIRHVLHHPTIHMIAHDSRLMGIAQSILGNAAFPFRATLFNKSPDPNWLIAWHQDTALPLREKRETPGWGPWSIKQGVVYAHAPAAALQQVLALRLHLDNSFRENGPLRLLPGTHRMGVLSDDQVAQLAKERSPFECVVAKGTVIAMRPLIVHASSKSASQESRRVLHIEYAANETFESELALARA